jgi:hypothetical protein
MLPCLLELVEAVLVLLFSIRQFIRVLLSEGFVDGDVPLLARSPLIHLEGDRTDNFMAS